MKAINLFATIASGRRSGNLVKKFTLENVEKIFEEHWRPGWGSVSAEEVLFVQDYLEKFKPKSFLEVGMASGLSGGLISQMLEWNGGESFTSIDYNDKFFGDTTKRNGFLMPAIYKSDKVKVQKHFFCITPDLALVNKKFDMCFIDANHQQPWPIIDTLCVFPYLTGKKIMIHHDLKLYRNQEVVRGIGPKYLYDQFPEEIRKKSEINQGNIFTLNLEKMSLGELEEIAISCLYLPWSLYTPLPPRFVQKIRSVLSENYSQNLLDAFDKSLKRFNVKNK